MPRGHAQHAREQWHEGANDRSEARKKHARDAVPLDESLAAADELRIEIERPRPQDLPLVVLAQPERNAIARDRTGRCRSEEQPRIDIGGGRERARAEERCRARYHTTHPPD